MIRKRIPHFSFLLVILALPRILAAGDLLVENLGDGGPGSLRAAIDAANTHPGADVIAFDPGLNGTITLASALPPLSDELTIDGPGADLITVSGDELHQPFSVVDGATVTLSALTISSGHGEFGGAISNEGNLTLSPSGPPTGSSPSSLRRAMCSALGRAAATTTRCRAT
jgi:hypothetical protein